MNLFPETTEEQFRSLRRSDSQYSSYNSNEDLDENSNADLDEEAAPMYYLGEQQRVNYPIQRQYRYSSYHDTLDHHQYSAHMCQRGLCEVSQNLLDSAMESEVFFPNSEKVRCNTLPAKRSCSNCSNTVPQRFHRHSERDGCIPVYVGKPIAPPPQRIPDKNTITYRTVDDNLQVERV